MAVKNSEELLFQNNLLCSYNTMTEFLNFPIVVIIFPLGLHKQYCKKYTCQLFEFKVV